MLDLKNGLRIAAFGAVLMCSSVVYAQEGEGAVIQNADQLTEAELQAAIQDAVDSGVSPEQIATILTQSGVDTATATAAMNSAGVQNAAAVVTTAAAQGVAQARTISAPANSAGSSDSASGIVVDVNGNALNVRTTQDLAQAALTNFVNNVRNSGITGSAGNTLARQFVAITIAQSATGLSSQQIERTLGNISFGSGQTNPVILPTPTPLPTPPPPTPTPTPISGA